MHSVDVVEGSGGAQTLARECQAAIDPQSGRGTFEDEQLNRIYHYAYGYGPGGGYQDKIFKPIVRAAMRTGWEQADAVRPARRPEHEGRRWSGNR